jgi:hypothetical protein
MFDTKHASSYDADNRSRHTKCERLITDTERKRNKHGPPCCSPTALQLVLSTARAVFVLERPRLITRPCGRLGVKGMTFEFAYHRLYANIKYIGLTTFFGAQY